MKVITCILLLCLLPLAGNAHALVLQEGATVAFSGKPQTVSLMLHNPGKGELTFELSARIYQTATVLAVPANTNVAIKSIRMLARQTVRETAVLQFPQIKTKTGFLVRWSDSHGHLLGDTMVTVYPDDTLIELRQYAQTHGPIGLFDPQNQLKPMLDKAKIRFVELNEDSLYQGGLMVIGPIPPGTLPPELSKKSTAAATLALVLPCGTPRHASTVYWQIGGDRTKIVWELNGNPNFLEDAGAQTQFGELAVLAASGKTEIFQGTIP